MKNKVFKRAVMILLCLASAFMLVSCGDTSVGAEDAFKAMMTDFQSGEKAKVVSHYNSEILQPFLGEEPLSDAIIKTLQGMTYEIISSEEIDDGHVKFNIKLSMMDSSAVMQQYVQKVVELIASPAYQEKVENMTEAEYQQLLREQMAEVLGQETLPMIEKETTVTMEKARGKWKIADPEAELPRMLFANLAQAVGALM